MQRSHNFPKHDELTVYMIIFEMTRNYLKFSRPISDFQTGRKTISDRHSRQLWKNPDLGSGQLWKNPNVIKRVTQQICIIILLHLGPATFGFDFGTARKPMFFYGFRIFARDHGSQNQLFFTLETPHDFK